MKYLYGFFYVIGILLLTSCSSSLRNRAVIHFQSLSEWPVLYEKNFNNIKNLQSNTRLTIESPELSTSFNAKLIYSAPDTFFLEAGGPLGIDIGKIFVGKNRFIIYNQYNNQFLTGSLDDNYYNTFLQTSLTFKQIKNALIGYVPLPDNIQLVDERHGVFLALNDGKKWRFVVNTKSGLLELLEIYEENRLILKQEFKRYQFLAGIAFPTLIRVVLPQRTEMVSILHKDIVINGSLDTRAYKIEISPKVDQIIVDG